jgi:hypothetical protein
MSNTTDKSQEAIEAALTALTAISKSSEFAKRTTDSKGNPISLESEIGLIHSIANEAVELLHDHLDEVSVE